jgi:hypothetical protein
MISMKQALKEQAKKFSDKILLEALKKHPVSDWRNWGDNALRIFAEEAFSRGLIK